jgi:hypothetical protein
LDVVWHCDYATVVFVGTGLLKVNFFHREGLSGHFSPAKTTFMLVKQVHTVH